jgi:hypothetical protein
MAESMAAICTGQWQDAHDYCQPALRLLRDRCAGVTWEVSSANILHLWSLMYLGRLRELSAASATADRRTRPRHLALATEPGHA